MRMANRWLIISGILLLLTACAKPPRQALDAAEYLVARAYAFQAPLYAAEEYQAASAALDESHRLIAARSYQAAEAALASARQHALLAYTLTETAKAREAAEAEAWRKAEEEARHKAEEEARHKAEEEARRKAEEEARRKAEEEAEAQRKAEEPRTFTSYRVESGETLASVAALPGVYGDPLLWPLLYQGNRDQIKDPGQIYAGQVLHIPRGLMPGDLDQARQKAREAGLFGLSASEPKPPATP